MSPGPVIQPLDLPEKGSEGPVEEDSSLYNVTIPELAEDLPNVEKEKEPAVPVSNSRLILKVRPTPARFNLSTLYKVFRFAACLTLRISISASVLSCLIPHYKSDIVVKYLINFKTDFPHH